MLLIFMHYQHSFPQLAFPEKPRQQATFTPHPAKGTPECTEVIMDQATSPHATSTRFDIGFSAPLHAGATGRVVLAHLDSKRQKNLLTATWNDLQNGRSRIEGDSNEN